MLPCIRSGGSAKISKGAARISSTEYLGAGEDFDLPGIIRTASAPNSRGNLPGDDGAAVHLCIIERRKRGDHGDAKRILARDKIPAEHAPGALRVANSNFSRESIDRNGEFHAAIQNFFGNRLRNFDSAGASEKSLRGVAHVRPAFQKNPTLTVYVNDVEAAFDPDEVISSLTILCREFRHRLRPLARTLHQFFSARRRVANAAVDFYADYFNLFFCGEQRAKRGDGIVHSGELRFARASDDNEDSVGLRIHFRGLWDCTCPRNEKTRTIGAAEELRRRRRERSWIGKEKIWSGL